MCESGDGLKVRTPAASTARARKFNFPQKQTSAFLASKSRRELKKVD
jgi:hypothetical protein